MPNPAAKRSLGAIVLIGGRSTRMGSDKAFLKLGKATFLQVLINSLSQVISDIVLVGNSEQELPEVTIPDGCKITSIRDQLPDSGPLEGIRVGLRELEPCCELGFVTSCDVPLLNPKIISMLMEKLGSGGSIVPRDPNGRIFGMSAIYKTIFHVEIENLIRERQLRVSNLADHFQSITIGLDEFRSVDPELDSFRNINHVSDYESLLARVDKRKP